MTPMRDSASPDAPNPASLVISATAHIPSAKGMPAAAEVHGLDGEPDAAVSNANGVPVAVEVSSTGDVPAGSEVHGVDGVLAAEVAAEIFGGDDVPVAARVHSADGVPAAAVHGADGVPVGAQVCGADGVPEPAPAFSVDRVPAVHSGPAAMNTDAPAGSGRRAAGSARALIVPALIVTAVVAMNAGFAGLGAVFDYPRVLSRPGAEVLASFRMHESAVVAWFSVLAVGALLFVPIALGVGRRTESPRMRWAVRAGVAAGLVQAAGLLRWPLLVPALADRAAFETGSSTAVTEFELWNRLLGSFVGETLGYSLTAAWTVLVVSVLGREGFPRWFAVLGAVSAALILAGVAAPWQVAGAQQANFAGYVLWSVWMLALAVLWGRRRA